MDTIVTIATVTTVIITTVTITTITTFTITTVPQTWKMSFSLQHPNFRLNKFTLKSA